MLNLGVDSPDFSIGNFTKELLDFFNILAIKWLKNEQEFVPDGSRVKAFLNEDGSFGLIFETTEAADKGTYTAVAVNDEGQARSNANVAIKTRLKEGVEKSAPSFR